ncbi:MAG: hypothetical protein AUG43_01915 [Actinobacteria bacterium 13_1_20CM_3_68_10]|nr:MAG: hypothetical protein AUG43_01915 [Actinobacteria bacterium 13_1_20CM_3_68_10]
MLPPILLIVSVDTEEDNWQPCRDGVTIDNIRELPRLDVLFQRLGVRATYFTTYQVAVRDWAAATLRQLRAGGAEIGAHLHPWNTPPLDESFLPRNSMLKNLPPSLQFAKLERLTATLREAIGTPPLAFRAGRYGLGRETVPALIRCGYQVDSSVTPFVSWEAFDDGPTFVGAPLEMYRLGGGGDVRAPEPGGALIELPMSIGYSRLPFGVWGRIYRMLTARPLHALHLLGIASRLGLITRILLSPETHSVADMLTLSRRLIESGCRHLHLFFHSPSLRPGLSPFVADAPGVERFYRTIASYVENLSRLASVTFVTVSEAAALLAAGSADQLVVEPVSASPK